ncbi:MAG: hypothetical protein ACT4OF_05060, partial [Caulobacteraceae bacterium]
MLDDPVRGYPQATRIEFVQRGVIKEEHERCSSSGCVRELYDEVRSISPLRAKNDARLSEPVHQTLQQPAHEGFKSCAVREILEFDSVCGRCGDA